MPDQQKPITSNGGTTDYSTKLETTGKPANRTRTQLTQTSNNSRNASKKTSSSNLNHSRNKPAHNPSSKTNNNKQRPTTKQQHPPVPNTHEKSSKPHATKPPSTSKRPPSQSSNQNRAGKRTNARPGYKASKRPTTKPTSKQTNPGTRVSSTKRQSHLKTVQEETISPTPEIVPQEVISPVHEAIDQQFVSSTLEPVVQEISSPVHETEVQEPLPIDLEEDATQPRMKAVSIPPTIIEPEPLIPTSDLDVTLPRIKPLKTPQIENELSVSSEKSSTVSNGAHVEADTIELTELKATKDTPVSPPSAILHRFRPGRIPASLIASILLLLLISSSFLFWRDISDTHLYLYALDPANGHSLVQQDLGGGYQDDTTFTNPISTPSSLVFGVHTNQSAPYQQQQILSLTGKDTSWTVVSQFSTPLEHGALTNTPDNDLIILSANGQQVTTSRGHLLWQMRGDEPTLGTHPFQPVFDNSTLYTVTSASHGEVAAYDLQSGTVRWTQNLHDTLAYAAPFLLHDNTLYIAADHTLYALNKVDGTLLWKIAQPVRTLLMYATEQPLLIVAGSQGLSALNPTTGAVVWNYDGQLSNAQVSTNETLMPAQYYQANISSATHMVYATGIVWDAQKVREQLWLYAVDAATGNLQWSKRISNDFVSADAGRIYPPFVDDAHRLVILQQAQGNGNRSISAYSFSDGSPLWNAQFNGVTASATTLLQVSNNSLILINTQSNKISALHSLTPLSVALITIIILSTVLLLLASIPLFQVWIQQFRKKSHAIPVNLKYPVKRLLDLWQNSRKVFILLVLILLILGGASLSKQLSTTGEYLNQVASPNGSIQWQRSLNSPIQLGLSNNQGSLVLSNTGPSLHNLTAININGATQWTTFASEGEFSTPETSTQPSTVLVALQGHTSLHYQFAPDDPAYAHPLDSLYRLYLLDRQTGQIIWQNTIIPPQEQQDTILLGMDANFFYISSRATNTLPPGVDTIAQLIAVDKTSGSIAWRIFGPNEPVSAQTDYGNLLLGGRSIIWQVSNTIYSIDTMLGQIQWRKFIRENLPQVSIYEETQMAETDHLLLITRSDAFHALDLTNGNARWVTANSGDGTTLHAGGVVAGNNTLILYSKSLLQAIDPSNQSIIWQQTQLDNIQSLKISDDGTLAYTIVTHLQPGNPTHQGFVALDTSTGKIRWTFQPSDQESFINAQSDGFQYVKKTLYVTLCPAANQTSCDKNVLYAINAATGTEDWKFEANSIYDVHVSPGSDSVAFQAVNSLWGNFIHRFNV